MELALLIAAAVVLVGGYKMFTMSRENANLKATITAKGEAVRELVPDLDDHLKSAQTFATEQDTIATAAENERVEALKLAGVKAEERDLALKLARSKREKINLV
ncbi:hypothetical protein KJZ63_03295 [Patescibacteria group bacterium]|nr:hypothetical protein [Patescibacteria group bacterium]